MSGEGHLHTASGLRVSTRGSSCQGLEMPTEMFWALSERGQEGYEGAEKRAGAWGPMWVRCLGRMPRLGRIEIRLPRAGLLL